MLQKAGERFTDALADEMGCDLVEVSAHFGARPEHEAWQGKVYSRSGTNPKYPNFYEATGYGTGAGLGGWNCRHSYYPFFEDSERAYSQEELTEYGSRKVTYNDTEMPEYDATQKQRSMERHIRATKRELAGYDAGIKYTDDDSLKEDLQTAFNRKSVLLKKQEAALKGFTTQTGLRRDRSREQVSAHYDIKGTKTVVAFNKSVSQKAINANNKMLQIEEEKRIIINNKISQIKSDLSDGTLPKALNVGNQNKHIPGSHSYNSADNRSYIFGDLNEAQENINQYAGTGFFKFNSKNEWTKKEFIETDINIGMFFDVRSEAYVPTNRFAIHYGKNGTHIVPARRRRKK